MSLFTYRGSSFSALVDDQVSFTITVPVDAREGDLLVLWVPGRESTYSPGASASGWSAVGAFLWKVAAVTDPGASVTVSITAWAGDPSIYGMGHAVMLAYGHPFADLTSYGQSATQLVTYSGIPPTGPPILPVTALYWNFSLINDNDLMLYFTHTSTETLEATYEPPPPPPGYEPSPYSEIIAGIQDFSRQTMRLDQSGWQYVLDLQPYWAWTQAETAVFVKDVTTFYRPGHEVTLDPISPYYAQAEQYATFGVHGTLALATGIYQDPTRRLYYSYRDGTTIKVAYCDSPAGDSWTPVTVATGASFAAAPFLCGTRWGDVFCWYHTTTAAQCYRSTNGGRSWQLWATISGLSYPRAVLTLDQQILVGYKDSALRVYHSNDYWQTTPTEVEIAAVSAASDHPATLAVDRRGNFHLVYRATDGKLMHRYGPHGRSLTTATEWVAAGKYPSLALGMDGGLLSYWDAGVLKIARVNSGYDTLGDLAATPSGSFAQGPTGLLYDHRQVAWLTGQESGGTVLTRYSKDPTRLWAA